jgi:hypothetical protein
LIVRIGNETRAHGGRWSADALAEESGASKDNPSMEAGSGASEGSASIVIARRTSEGSEL